MAPAFAISNMLNPQPEHPCITSTFPPSQPLAPQTPSEYRPSGTTRSFLDSSFDSSFASQSFSDPSPLAQHASQYSLPIPTQGARVPYQAAVDDIASLYRLQGDQYTEAAVFAMVRS